MTALLLDTSAWVEYLRDTGSRGCEEVAGLLGGGKVVTTSPVVMELLAGAASEAALHSLEQVTAALPLLPLDQAADFHAAATVYRTARRGGRTVRGLVDCLLAVVAVRTGAVLVHRDADLALLGELLPDLRTLDLR